MRLMGHESPITKAAWEFAMADPENCDKEWAAYLALVNVKESASASSPTNSSSPLHHHTPAAAVTAPSATRSTASLRVLSSAVSTDEFTVDDLSPAAQRLYDFLGGGSSSPTPAAVLSSSTATPAPTPAASRAAPSTKHDSPKGDLAPEARDVSTMLRVPSQIDVIYDAVDIDEPVPAVSARNTCSAECPSDDAHASVSMDIASATPNSATTTCCDVPELAAPAVSDKALDVDDTGDPATTTAIQDDEAHLLRADVLPTEPVCVELQPSMKPLFLISEFVHATMPVALDPAAATRATPDVSYGIATSVVNNGVANVFSTLMPSTSSMLVGDIGSGNTRVTTVANLTQGVLPTFPLPAEDTTCDRLFWFDVLEQRPLPWPSFECNRVQPSSEFMCKFMGITSGDDTRVLHEAQVCWSFSYLQLESGFLFCLAGRASLPCYSAVQFQWEIAWPTPTLSYSIHYVLHLHHKPGEFTRQWLGVKPKIWEIAWTLQYDYAIVVQNARLPVCIFAFVEHLYTYTCSNVATIHLSRPVISLMTTEVLASNCGPCSMIGGTPVHYSDIFQWETAWEFELAGVCSSFAQRQGNPKDVNGACSNLTTDTSLVPWDPGIWALLCFYGADRPAAQLVLGIGKCLFQLSTEYLELLGVVLSSVSYIGCTAPYGVEQFGCRIAWLLSLRTDQLISWFSCALFGGMPRFTIALLFPCLAEQLLPAGFCKRIAQRQAKKCESKNVSDRASYPLRLISNPYQCSANQCSHSQLSFTTITWKYTIVLGSSETSNFTIFVPLLLPWDPGGCANRLGDILGIPLAVQSVNLRVAAENMQAGVHVQHSCSPWNPGESTRHRLEGKPDFKKGGLSATLPVMDLLHLAWAGIWPDTAGPRPYSDTTGDSCYLYNMRGPQMVGGELNGNGGFGRGVAGSRVARACCSSSFFLVDPHLVSGIHGCKY